MPVRVLVVDDDALTRSVLSRLIRSAGHEITGAGSGAEALEHLRARPYDVLLTDQVMPGMSGRELADRLLARRPGLKVLYMSGYTDDAIAHRGVLDPGRHFIDKPFDAATLARKVRKVLDAG